MKLFYPLAAVLALSGCAKEIAETPSDPRAITCICVCAPQTRTVIGDAVGGAHPIYWENGDRLCAGDLVSNPLTVEGQTSRATFIFPGAVIFPAGILYPSSYYKSEGVITLPDEVALKPVVPMAGKMDTGSSKVSLKTLTAVVRVPLKLAAQDPDTDTISVINLSASGARLSGDFSVDYEAGTMKGLGTESATARQNVRVDTVLSAEPLDICFAVPGGSYTLNVKVVDVNGHTMTKTLTKNFETGRIYSTPVTEFVPTGTEGGLEVSSAPEWNEFATGYNSGELSATKTVVLTGDLDFTGLDLVTIDTLGCAVTNPDGYVIKNLALSNASLIREVRDSGKVDGLVFDSSVTLSVTPSGSGYYSPLCLKNYGAVSHCTVASEIQFSFSADSLTAYIGAIAALNAGTVSGCEYSGTISNRTSGDTEYASEIIAGGISALSASSASVISDCTFSGKLLVGAAAGESGYAPDGVVTGVTLSNKFGGICAEHKYGTMSGCKTDSKSLVDVRGALALASVGGIAGYSNATIDNCTNAAAVLSALDAGDTKDFTNTVGGIAGRTGSSSVISGCANAGAVKCATVCRHNSIGGIAGYLSGRIENTHNTGSVWQGERGPRYIHIGGVCGQNYADIWSGAVYNTGSVNPTQIGSGSTLNCINAGGLIGRSMVSVNGAGAMYNEGYVNVNCTPVLISGQTYGKYESVNVGGIIGLCEADGITVSNFTNKGRVHAQSTNLLSGTDNKWTALGGIVGAAKKSCTVSGCSNEITGCIESAVPTADRYGYTKSGVRFQNSTITASGCNTRIFTGGILGAGDAEVHIVSCSNSSSLVHNTQFSGQSAKNKLSAVAGIAGCLTGAGSTIAGCENTGGIFSYNYSNSSDPTLAPMSAGIVGFMTGTEASRCSVTGCSVSGTDSYAYRGFNGGIAAYVSHVDIGGEGNLACSVSGVTLTGNSNCVYLGGLVACSDSSTVSDCKCMGEISGVKNSAGLVAKATGINKVSGCVFNGTVQKASVNTYAGIAMAEGADYSFTGNGIAGSVAGTAVTSGNLGTLFAPSGVTVTGTYLYTEL